MKSEFTYDNTQISKSFIASFIVDKLGLVEIFNSFYENFIQNSQKQENISSLIEEQVSTLLKNLVDNNNFSQMQEQSQIVQKLTSKNLIRLACHLKKNEKTHYFISKITAKINPNIVDYKDVNMICYFLLNIVEQNSHELLVFESLLGLIQFSSLGDHVTETLLLNKNLKILEVITLEENSYVIHAALELFTNILASEKGQVALIEGKNTILQNIVKIAFSYFSEFYQRDISKDSNFNRYDHPLKIINTILSIASISSSIEASYIIFKENGNEILNLETLLGLIIKCHKCSSLKLEFIYKYFYILSQYEGGSQFKQNRKLMEQCFIREMNTIDSQLKKEMKDKIQFIENHLN